jgi:hypothetical protein
MRQNAFVIIALFMGIMFGFFSILAWMQGRRVGGVLLAVVAGIDLAFAISALQG